jgi:glutamine amidotransferase
MIRIINTGVANIRSLEAAFDRLQQPWQLTEDANQIESASHVVLPGVGAFAAAAEAIDRLGLRQSVIDRIASDKRLLCICLGMQLLAESSEEAPGVPGLGVIPHQIKRFSNAVAVPQLGWNEVRPLPSERSAGSHSENGPTPYEAGEAYFANSFRLTECPDGWGCAETQYDGTFVSSIWRGRVLACQFHPELSGVWGQQLLANWVGEI